MNIQEAYNTWAGSYDTVVNKTRDLEAVALRALLPTGPHAEVVELGCGTGKNTAWLATQATHLTAVDFSAEMLAQARTKNRHPNVSFYQADVTQPWQFLSGLADVLTCSLILEHVPHLDLVFAPAQKALRPGGLFYVGELHPFKQYQGSKARFDTAEGRPFELECHVHHVSDFTESARRHGFRCAVLQEWFDENNRAGPPRLVSFLFQREG